MTTLSIHPGHAAIHPAWKNMGDRVLKNYRHKGQHSPQFVQNEQWEKAHVEAFWEGRRMRFLRAPVRNSV